jgi:septal ring factor EnvC (AmiA/AmiB activator)
MPWIRQRLMQEIRDEIRLTREDIALSREELRLSRESRADLHDFIQQQTRRMERAAEHQGRELAKIGTAMDRLIERLDDMGDQIRANTEATWRMLDRLDGDGGAAAA